MHFKFDRIFLFRSYSFRIENEKFLSGSWFRNFHQEFLSYTQSTACSPRFIPSPWFIPSPYFPVHVLYLVRILYPVHSPCFILAASFIDNSLVHQVVSTKSLGVYVVENLLWNVHINNIIWPKRLLPALISWREVGLLLRLKCYQNINTIYSTLVQPCFDYCSVVWVNCNKFFATELQKCQNRAARILTFSPYDASVNNLFPSLAWKKLEAQWKIQTTAIVYKYLNGLAQQYLNLLFSYCD